MTPVTRAEEWIAPRAMKLLGLIAVLVLAGGVLAAYLVRENDLNRVERLERVVSCEDSLACREFVERAIREILHEQRKAPNDKRSDKGAQGITFRFGSSGLAEDAPLLVEAIPDTGDGHSEGQNTAPKSVKPPGERESVSPPVDTPGGAKSPQEPAQPVSGPPPAPAPPPSPPEPERPGKPDDKPPPHSGQSIVEAPESPVSVCVPPAICLGE